MQHLKPNSQKAQDYLRRYKYCRLSGDNKGESLFEIYNSFSEEKETALYYCKMQLERMNGYKPVFLNHNIFQFVYAYLCEITGNKYLYVITRRNEYIIPFNE